MLILDWIETDDESCQTIQGQCLRAWTYLRQVATFALRTVERPRPVAVSPTNAVQQCCFTSTVLTEKKDALPRSYGKTEALEQSSAATIYYQVSRPYVRHRRQPLAPLRPKWISLL